MDLQEKFIEYLRYEKKYSEHTIRAYESDIDSLLEHSTLEVQQITPSDIRDWQINESGKVSDNSRKRGIYAIRSMYKFLVTNELLERNPAEYIEAPKTDSRNPEFFSEAEMKKLFELPFSDDFRGTRDKTMLELLYFTGIRVSELIDLKLSDLDLASGEIQIMGKGSKERLIPISDALQDKLARYISLLQDEFKRCQCLFPTNKGKKGYQLFVQRIMQKYLSQVTTKNVYPHMMRHTFASHMLNGGAELIAISEFLGHESVSTTQIYSHLDMRTKKAALKHHPLD